ncbi:MAG: hypothetical protein M3032_04195, partial [Verrucomicrobiota bacterium]|nr:hypothetical protein [Verrucomicrobiota bacterium]
MASPASRFLCAVCLGAFARLASAQQPVLPASDLHSVALSPIADQPVNPYGLALAQIDSAIEQARLQRDLTPPASGGVDANGTALASSDATSSDDDSFGAQQILKSQERVRSFVVTGGLAIAYTDNVALTRRGERDDVFAILDAGLGWSKKLSHEMEANVGAHTSIFRYDRTSSLDFENIGFGAGLSWTPANLAGASTFARYDFTELLDRDGGQILMEHALTVGVQKAIALGRSHGLAFG